MLRACPIVLAALLLIGCSSSDDPEATPTAAASNTPQATATPQATSTPQPTQTPVVVVVTATPVPQAAPQQPAAAPQQPSGPPPGQVACAVATAPESQALSLLFAQLVTGANTAQQTAIRGAFAQVDRNNDGVVDAGVCRDAVIQVTQALNALRPR